jgi:hypothetical protein
VISPKLTLILIVWTSTIGKFILESALLWFQENNQAIVKTAPFPGHRKNTPLARGKLGVKGSQLREPVLVFIVIA